MSDNSHSKEILEISTDKLRRMGGREGLILQGCGGDLQEWVDGINQILTDAGILLDGTRFENVVSFQHEGLTNLLFPFEDAKVDAGKFAMWRLQTHEQFGGTWLSDYVPNRLGGFVQEQRPQKPRMELEGQDGNIFAILANASMTLSKAGQREQIDEMFQRVQSCGDYNKALGIIREYVDTELSVPQQSRANHSQTKARDQHER